MTLVVDTNVAVVANERNSPQASPQCVAACVQRISRLVESERIALDDRWVIIGEYKRHLRSSGEPGVGDHFLRWVLTNVRNPECCALVTPAEFPNDPRLTAFDPADRKFVEVSLAHTDRPPILQAVDTKWRQFEAALGQHDVAVEFLC